MSSTVPQAGSNTPTRAQTAPIDDVIARVMQSSVNSGIEDIIIIDGADQVEEVPSEACTCGMCGVVEDELIDFNATDIRSTLAGAAPMLYIETRANSLPLVLDEYTIAADIEIISPKMISQTDNPTAETTRLMDAPYPNWSQVSLASVIDQFVSTTNFDPNSFDPYDPGIAVASDVL
jgi:hypothetical protein